MLKKNIFEKNFRTRENWRGDIFEYVKASQSSEIAKSRNFHYIHVHFLSFSRQMYQYYLFHSIFTSDFDPKSARSAY